MRTCENHPWKPVVQNFVRTINAENHLPRFFLKFGKPGPFSEWEKQLKELGRFLKPAPKAGTNGSYRNENRPTVVETTAQHLSNPYNMGFLYRICKLFEKGNCSVTNLVGCFRCLTLERRWIRKSTAPFAKVNCKFGPRGPSCWDMEAPPITRL